MVTLLTFLLCKKMSLLTLNYWVFKKYKYGKTSCYLIFVVQMQNILTEFHGFLQQLHFYLTLQRTYP